MRWVLVLAVGIAFVLVAPAPASAGGGNQEFRILTHGDVVVLPLAVVVACRQPSYDPTSPHCYLQRNVLGYDGYTGAVINWPDHVGHDFTCAVTNSATPGLESISVAFDVDGDTIVDGSTAYPNTVYRPLDETGLMPGGVPIPGTGVEPVDNALGLPGNFNPGFLDGHIITGILRGQWWPEVSGLVLGNGFGFLFNHLGEDVTVGCSF